MRLVEIKKPTVDYQNSNAQATQRSNTGPSYQKAAEWIVQNKPDSLAVLDYGAGRLLGSKIMMKVLKKNVHSHEPYPREGVTPTHIDPPPGHHLYDVVVALNLLNVLLPDERSKTVKRIAKLLKKGGSAIIGVRKWNGGVNDAKNRWDAEVHEPKSLFTKSEGKHTYQKGYDGNELVDYLEDFLGPRFEVVSAGSKFGDRSAIITKR